MTQSNSPGSRSSKKLTFGLLFFTEIVLAVSLPLRIFQQFYLVEPSGFWRRAEATQFVLYTLLAVLVLVPAVCGFLLRHKAALDLTRRRRAAEGVAALFAACAMLADAVASGVLANDLLRALAASAGSGGSQMIFRSGAAAVAMEAVFAVLGALLFVNLAMVDLFTKKKIYLNRLLLLAPVIWAASGMLRRFARTINYLRVSDLFLSVLTLAALTLFFLYFAQLFSGISGERRAARLFAAGIPAAVLCLLCFVPRAAAYLGGAALSQDAALDLWALALPAFILIVIAGRLRVGNPEEEAKPAEEIKDEAQAKEEAPEEARTLEELGDADGDPDKTA